MATNSPAAAKGKAPRKRKRSAKTLLKPGDEGYRTPTQLRNARKRRAQQKREQKGTEQPTKHERDPSCQYLANPKAAPLVQSAKAFFKPLLSVPFKVEMGPTKGWRTVAKLAVRPDANDQVSIGLFAPNSHKLIPVPECVAHHPSINSAVTAVERLCRQTKVQPFNETLGEGHLRHLAVNVERSSGKVQVTLVWNSSPYQESDINNEGKIILDSLTKAIIAVGAKKEGSRQRRRGRKGGGGAEHPGKAPAASSLGSKFALHSLWVHFNSSWKHANAVFSIDGGSASWHRVYGPEYIVESLDLKKANQAIPVPLCFPPNVFRQANIDQFTAIVVSIRKRFSKLIEKNPNRRKPTCLELYGGVGTLGLNVVDLTASLVSSDENPFNKQCFEKAALDIQASHASYESKNATDMVKSRALDSAEVVIVDPPRKGLDEPVLKALRSNPTPRLLVYVSCGFDAFQRDCAELTKSAWTLEAGEGHLLFPGSNAIETLAFFVKQ